MYDNSSVCIYYMRYLTRAGTYIHRSIQVTHAFREPHILAPTALVRGKTNQYWSVIGPVLVTMRSSTGHY